MNGVWNAPETCNGMTFFAPEVLGVHGRRLDAAGRPGDHDLARSVVVGDPDVVVGTPARDVDLVVVEAEHGGHRAGLARPASCIAALRSHTSRIPSSKPSAPVAVSAVYSPRLWPAQ